MAALIQGYTVHSWGEVPINREKAGQKSSKHYADRDVSSMFSKCSELRWIILDEVEAVLGARCCLCWTQTSERQ